MATDMLEKRTFPCEPATIDEIGYTLWSALRGNDADIAVLQRSTCPIKPNQVPWTALRFLGIWGTENRDCSTKLEQAGLEPGFYISSWGDALVLIHQNDAHIQQYVDRCKDDLKILRIHNTSLSSLNVSSLANLQKLYVMGNHALSSLEGLKNLTQLTTLELYDCKSLTALPGLENLTQLTTLELYECNSLTALPELENLTQLTSLNLSFCRRLAALPELENLTQLTSLNLSWCERLTALPRLDNLTHMTKLVLENCCKLTTLPDSIRQLQSLRRLDLSRMHLHSLPDWLPEITERFTTNYFDTESGTSGAIVNLGKTAVDGVDMSIFEQPYEMVVEWFEKRKQGQTHPLNEIKVVFLGDGEAGKSHTIARLMNDGGKPVGYVDVRTPGIVIKNKAFPVGNRDATLHFWDFGGQDIMHSMHRIFLTERTIYVVLVDASIGNQDERARYWLGNIQSFAKDAPVILVLNKLDDGLQADVNAVDLYSKYKGLKKIVKLSAKQYSKERFNTELRNVLLDEIEQTGYLNSQWPNEWIQVKKELEQMDENYIHGARYMDICRRLNVEKNQKSLLQWFHDLGISFCYCDGENGALEDYVVLKPNWITNALYIILFNEREGGNGGLVPIRTIRTMLGKNAPNKDTIKRVIPDAYYAGYDVNYVLDVFHAFKLSFPKDEYEFFPMLADVNSKPVANDYAQDRDCLEFNMEFDYLPPNNLIHRLMVERSAELDMDNVWRTGARFQLPELGLSAVVVIDGNLLRFFIRHTDPVHKSNIYLAMLKANVDRIIAKMGLTPPECKLIYKFDGKRDEFDYEELKLLLEVGQTAALSKAHKRMIPIQDIFRQSAPEDLQDDRKLLEKILVSCRNLQGEPNYRISNDPEHNRGLEDLRNRRVRDNLENWGYIVKDQPQYGRSGTGKSIGELDILVYSEGRKPWTVIEALRLSKYETVDWNHHLDKLLYNYNYFGAHSQYLLTYVDCRKEDFGGIWTAFKAHIQGQSGGGFPYVEGSFVDLNDPRDPLFVKKSLCRYNCGGQDITVFHIFVQIDLP